MAGITPYQALGKAMMASAGFRARIFSAGALRHPTFDPVIAQLFPAVGINTLLLNLSQLAVPAAADRAERFAALQPLAAAARRHLLAMTPRDDQPAAWPLSEAILQPFRHLTAIVPEDLTDFDSLNRTAFWIAAGALQMDGTVSVLAGESAMQVLQRVPNAFPQLLSPSGRIGDSDTEGSVSRHTVVVGAEAAQSSTILYVFTARVRGARGPTQDAVRAAYQMFGAPTEQPVAT